MKIDELKSGTVYWSNNRVYPKGHLWEYNGKRDTYYIGNEFGIYDDLKRIGHNTGINISHWENLREATPEEVQWLNICKAKNKVIPMEEFPEYYEFVGYKGSENKNFTIGRVYKIKDRFCIEKLDNFIDNNGNSNGFSGNNHVYFKPSTKEAYEEQERQKVSKREQREFKVGDKVYIECNVVSVNVNENYPILVSTEGGMQLSFTKDGRFEKSDSISVLKHIEDINLKSEYPKWMMVKIDDKWVKRKVIYKDDFGYAFITSFGKTLEYNTVCSCKLAKEIESKESKEEQKPTFNGVGVIPQKMKLKFITPPPIGVMPKEIWEEKKKEERLEEVKGAISRYFKQGLPILPKWIEEYNELVEEVKGE